MSQDFNPYREWLGVRSASPSPSYYELLGLRPLEGDIGKINGAYQRQSSQLAARLGGSQADLAQRLMSELAEARMTLMTPTAKRAYDQALAARGATAPVPTTHQGDGSSASDVLGILPPAASPQAAGPAPAVLANAGVSYHPAMAQPYPGQGYAAGPYAPQAYPASPGQAHPASLAAANYYPAPQVVASAPVMPLEPQTTEGVPTIRRRPARRRSSPVPALIGTLVVAAGIVGGAWFYYKGDEAVALVGPGDGQTRSADSPAPSSLGNPNAQPAPEQRTVAKKEDTASPAAGDSTTDADTAKPKPTDSPAAARGSTNDASTSKIDSADNSKPAMEKPAEEGTDAQSPSQSQKSPPESTPPDKPIPEPKPSDPSPEEAAAVARSLQEVRAALASRDLSKAKDLLDEATIEATAPGTLAQVNRVETLTNYVEMFWDAARKTLPKLEAAETIEIDGKMIAVVEADENHLVVRIEGRNREYAWKKIPAKIAYYLANRWLTPDDPVRNLVLAAFEIVEPKGDLAHAASLLEAAKAARLNAEPLYAELKAARGG